VLPVAVLAGGLGTRLREITGADLPKAMVPVLGRPFVDHKLESLAAAGTTQVVLLLGHGGEAVREHVGEGGQFGLSVRYMDDGGTLRGTGGALVHALPVLGDVFWVTYGDTLLSFDVVAAEQRFAGSPRCCLMTVLHNRDAGEPSNTRVEGHHVEAYGKHPRPAGAQHIDYGMLVLARDALTPWLDYDDLDLADVLHSLARGGEVDAFEVTEPYFDIGTVDALRATEEHLRQRGMTRG
jgi:NDP-sugar pyrophosphorylase family protein